VVDKEKERDWDREMREVDKLLAKLPDADPTLGRKPVYPPLGGIPTVRTAAPASLPGGTRSIAATWVRLGLGLLLGVGMLIWPYSHVCGIRLMFYGLGALTLVVAGVWSALASWKYRQGFAHLLSILLVIWGLILVMGTVLPRVGYAGQNAVWLCPEPTPPPPPNR
jgi:hypothetical protein